MSGLRGVEYLEGSTPATRYELAPSVQAVVSCLGVLLGRPEVKSPAQLEALWRERQPGRRMELRVSPRGDRLFVIEPQP